MLILIKGVSRNTTRFFGYLSLLVCSLVVSPAVALDADVPVATDSRIKTFVYNENDVYNIVTHYGYQSNVEFGLNEEVETVSLGDRVPFQVVPAGRRLFVRAMTANARTNMTVITNKHAYQFDLAAVPAPSTPNEELVYVVRFFYPDDRKNQLPTAFEAPAPAAAPVAAPIAASEPVAAPFMAPAAVPVPVTPVAAAPEPITSTPLPAPTLTYTPAPATYNYHYTLSGDNSIAPLKIYDDGKSTYFKFPITGAGAPTIYKSGIPGRETVLPSRAYGEYTVVEAIAPQFEIRQGNYAVTVYNEKLSHN